MGRLTAEGTAVEACGRQVEQPQRIGGLWRAEGTAVGCGRQVEQPETNLQGGWKEKGTAIGYKTGRCNSCIELICTSMSSCVLDINH